MALNSFVFLWDSLAAGGEIVAHRQGEVVGREMATMAVVGRMTTTRSEMAMASSFTKVCVSSSASPTFLPTFAPRNRANPLSTVSRPWRQCESRARRGSVCMSVSVGAETATSDTLFADYKASTAFLFPGQVQCLDYVLWFHPWSSVQWKSYRRSWKSASLAADALSLLFSFKCNAGFFHKRGQSVPPEYSWPARLCAINFGSYSKF